MKINCYLENTRRCICDAIQKITDEPGYNTEARRDMVQALTELDAFRHGKLQSCSHCPDVVGPEEGP